VEFTSKSNWKYSLTFQLISIQLSPHRLLKETIIDLACKLQDKYCLDKVTELWSIAKPNFLSENFDNT